MLHKGIKFAYALTMIASAAIAFIVVRNFDEFATVGPAYTIYFDKADDGAGAGQVADAVEVFAQSHRVNIGRLYYDPLNETVRHVYLAVGDPNATSSSWLADGYPYFSREAKLDIRPYREIASIAPDGTYLVYGSQTAASGLLQEFQKLGYRGELDPTFSIASVTRYFGHGAVLYCFLIVCLVAIVGVASAVALNAKSYGIQRLQGQGFLRILWRDFKQLSIFCAVAAGAVSIATVVSLYAYNGLNRFGLYVIVALSFAAVYAIAAIITHVATLALLHRGVILSAVKGEVTAAWAIIGSYVLRCWGVLLILSISTSAIASGLDLRQQHDKYQTWAAVGSAYYLRISGSIEYLKNGREVDDRIGKWIRDADARNEVPLASPQNLPGVARTVLVVNNRYLSKNRIYDSTGAKVLPQDGTAIRILVPKQFSGNSTSITSGLKSWAELVNPHRRAPLPDIKIGQSLDNQRVASYTRSITSTNPMVKDPIIVVITGTSEVISNHEYVTMASNGEILVEDPNQAMRSLAEAGVGPYILGLSPFAQDAADSYRDAKRDFSVEAFNLMAGIAMLLVTALAVSVVYCRRNTQTLFVKYIHGWAFARTHWRILSFETALALASVLWIWYKTAAIIDAHEFPGAPPMLPGELVLGGWEPLVAVGIALANLTIIFLTLARTNFRFVKAHSASLT